MLSFLAFFVWAAIYFSVNINVIDQHNEKSKNRYTKKL